MSEIIKVGAIETPYPIDDHASKILSTDIPRSIDHYINDLSATVQKEAKGFKTKIEFREPRIMPILTNFTNGALYSLTPWTVFMNKGNINIYQFSEYLEKYAGVPESRDLSNLANIDPIELYNNYGSMHAQAKFRLLTDFNPSRVVDNFYGNIYRGEPCRVCWGHSKAAGSKMADRFYNSVFNGDLGSKLRNISNSSIHKFDMNMRLSMEDNLRKIKPIANSVHQNIVGYIIIAGIWNQLSKTKIMDLSFRYQTGVY